MSHFTCLVIAKDHKAALQPFHEFECTGTNDQYVQDMDVTAERREEYEANTESTLTDPQGNVHFMFNEKGDFADVRFFKVEEHGQKRSAVPEGWTRGESPTKERQSFRQWLAYNGTPASTEIDSDQLKYGYYVASPSGEVEKVIRRTNPNKKWDWWTEGGRWSGKLIFKNGRKGDSGKAGDIDWDAMLARYAGEAAEVFDRITAGIAGREVVTWKQTLAKRDAGEFDMDGARSFYNEQLVIKDLIATKVIDAWDGAEELSGVLEAVDRAAYIERNSQTNATTWAMLHEGRWNERGEMGWWGMSDATADSTKDYVTEFWRTVRALPSDEVVTVVDCHI